MDIGTLLQAYKTGAVSPSQVVKEIYAQIREKGERPVWITLVDEQANLERACLLEEAGPDASLSLYGIPFAVKDNIDVVGMATTAGCPDFAYIPTSSAEVVDRLLRAGAILIGKTNMDQFATGLVGVRSPYGVCSSVFNSKYISGGSSSGSAVAVGQGVVSFSLGTDTAGSGRVPAAFNNLVGLKPTRGLVSTHGVVPACKTLDCVSIFAETCGDAARVLKVIRGADAKDSFSRTARPGEGATPWIRGKFKFGVPTEESLEFFEDDFTREGLQDAIKALRGLGGEEVRFDYGVFKAVADLLYSGPWVAERLAAVHDFVDQHLGSMDPTVGKIIKSGEKYTAVHAFEAEYKLKALRQSTSVVLDTVDFLLLPTAPTTYTVEQVESAPLELNTKLGYYTNFVNLLDLAAVSVPVGMRPDGLPVGVSLIGRAFTDEGLLLEADYLHRALAKTLGGSARLLSETKPLEGDATPSGCVLMAVVGAHLSGEPLNWQLTLRKARFVRKVKTLPEYKLFALSNSIPPKPGMVHSPGFAGPGIDLEVWAMPEDTVGSFLMGIPAPLCLGTIRLEDGTMVKGFLCEPSGVIGADDITHFGGWRAYLKSR